MGEWHYPNHFTHMAKAFKRSETGLVVKHFAEHVVPHMRQTATALGYSLATHGSLERDLDLIAVPWRDDACAPVMLVKRLCETICEQTGWGKNQKHYEPTEKPHGRLAFTITGSFQVDVDLSVFPPTTPEIAA